MKAYAKRIGKSSNEAIFVDGDVFIKSTKIGKWNYVCRVTYDGNDNGFILKSATKEGVQKASNGFVVNVLTSDIAEVERI